ncbi:MAG: DUF5043 domain-containing protein [Rikenellaceae bacterium]|nr:DUF5043 domain-containing protein [Rikenellaceae bacterium]
MKKIIAVTTLLLATPIAWSQTFYYDQTKQITGNGFVYQCDNIDGDITLYNANSRFVYHEWTYKDGSKPEDEILRGFKNTIDFDDKSYEGLFTIVRNGFDEAQKATIGNRSLYVMAYIDPATGKIADVEFAFFDEDPFAEIPVEVYYNIEQQLKQQQVYKITDVGRQLNYCFDVAAVEINPFHR